MDVLTFELSGKHAHFRKYYTNNTALSYFIPPRTTLMGLFGAVLGLEKDSYHEALSSDRIRIGIGVVNPLKKAIHRLNWLKIEGANDFRGIKQHTQTPFEMVSAMDFPSEDVTYRVFVAATTGGEAVFDQLAQSVLQQKQVYGLSLGPANLTAWIRKAQLLPASVHDPNQEYVDLHSATPSHAISKLDAKKISIYAIEEELFPADFRANYNREVTKMVRLIFSTDGNRLPCMLNLPYYSIELAAGEKVNFTFIE